VNLVEEYPVTQGHRLCPELRADLRCESKLTKVPEDAHPSRPISPLLLATTLGICRGRIVARRPVRIGPVRSVIGVQYVRARHCGPRKCRIVVLARGLSAIQLHSLFREIHVSGSHRHSTG
jgi:hypothetical protein